MFKFGFYETLEKGHELSNPADDANLMPEGSPATSSTTIARKIEPGDNAGEASLTATYNT